MGGEEKKNTFCLIWISSSSNWDKSVFCCVQLRKAAWKYNIFSYWIRINTVLMRYIHTVMR